MKAKTALIAAFCILSLAGCQNGTHDIPTADTTVPVQSAETTETTSAVTAADTEAVQKDTEQRKTPAVSGLHLRRRKPPLSDTRESASRKSQL